MDNNKPIKLRTPLDEEKIASLKAGDMILLSGKIIGARDMAHRRIQEWQKNRKKLPVDLTNETIFYVGPSPTPPGKNSGSVGPTTSARMDNISEPLLKAGVKAMIGKGTRSNNLKSLLNKYRAVYLVAVGGVSAFLSTKVKKIEKVAFKDLGPEAIFSIDIFEFPLFVAYDIYGGDIFEDARRVE